jgi:hypothetical protein
MNISPTSTSNELSVIDSLKSSVPKVHPLAKDKLLRIQRGTMLALERAGKVYQSLEEDAAEPTAYLPTKDNPLLCREK